MSRQLHDNQITPSGGPKGGSLYEVLNPALLQHARLEDSSHSDNTSRLENVKLLKKDEGPLVKCKKELESLQIKLEPKTGWRATKARIVLAPG